MLLSVPLLLLFINDIYSLPQIHQGKRIYHNNKNNQLNLNSKITNNFEDKIDLSYSSYFTQKIDHFNRDDERTFQQRYFINSTYYDLSLTNEIKSNAPVFLCVGGEGPPLDYTVLTDSVHCTDMVEIAGKYNALLLALEHRYYGPSNPFDDLSNENLIYLNSEQALADIAYFHQYITNKYNLSITNKWITWGGSYPGMMAAMSRLRYPHIIHASISSSSPLQAQVNMKEYNDVVANSLSAKIVGGSEECLNVIKSGHNTIGEMLKTTEGQTQLEQLFNICDAGSLNNIKNQEQFAGDGVIYIPAQSNDPECTTPYCNIASICDLMTNDRKGSPLDKLVYLSKIQHANSCVSISYDNMINVISNPKNPERSWLYQTCTEWGFYQTCELNSNCPYTQGLHTLDVDYDICDKAFNIPSNVVNNQIEFTNSMYGGKNIQATRILYPNGQIDPWSSLGVLNSPNKLEPTLWVEGASHHYWTHPSLPTDSIFVKNARKIIWAHVEQWLKEDSNI